MSDVVLRPALPSAELEKIRKNELSELQSNKDDPGAISDNVSNRLTFGKNHPYGDIATEKTINNVKLDDIKKYFATYWKPNNAYLVFVGAIAPEEARQLAVQYFGAWQKGVVPKPVYKTPQPHLFVGHLGRGRTFGQRSTHQNGAVTSLRQRAAYTHQALVVA